MNIKRLLPFLLIAIFFASDILADELKKVFIIKYVEHPALDVTIKGIKDGLEERGYKDGQNIELRVKSAQGQPSLLAQIAENFVSKADVTVGVPTMAAQSLLKYAKKNQTKLVFSSVTDPLKAGLVKSLEQPENNTSGVSNFIDLEPQIELFRKIQPNLKNLGFLYNASEINSLSIKEKLAVICAEQNIKLTLQTVSKTSEVAQAVAMLADVQAIFISNDNTALSALPVIINIANNMKIPVYVSDLDAVASGALAVLGPNQYDIGLQTAEIISRALLGEDLGRMPVEFPRLQEIYLNESAAYKLGIKFSEELKKDANKIIYDN